FRGLKNPRPAFHHSVPRLRRIEPAKRRAGRPACLMVTRVLFERICQVRAKRRSGKLIARKLRLRRERKARREILQTRYVERNSSVIELARIKFVSWKQFGDQSTKLLDLSEGDLRTRRMALI